VLFYAVKIFELRGIAPAAPTRTNSRKRSCCHLQGGSEYEYCKLRQSAREVLHYDHSLSIAEDILGVHGRYGEKRDIRLSSIKISSGHRTSSTDGEGMHLITNCQQKVSHTFRSFLVSKAEVILLNLHIEKGKVRSRLNNK